MQNDFVEFPKMPRLTREAVITEKLDGTNAQVFITEEGDMLCGSRKRWITPEDDNHGFAKWAMGNKDELLKLGPGRHFGEWWGEGIQRGYGIKGKRFSLFNVSRWNATTPPPECCHVVPVLFESEFSTVTVEDVLTALNESGSVASPGFMRPEGVVIFHTALNRAFKKTIEKDAEPKSKHHLKAA